MTAPPGAASAPATAFFSARSRHPGGVGMTMTDGSVKFIKDTVNAMTWYSLATRANAEVLSSDAY
ncbi:MAG: H-X9-DG-CTERM domain-containing protein [Isosphaeraceae bacterium]